jgi:hypothetical protein
MVTAKGEDEFCIIDAASAPGIEGREMQINTGVQGSEKCFIEMKGENSSIFKSNKNKRLSQS